MDVLFVSAILILLSVIIYLLWYILLSKKKLTGDEESDILTLLTEFKHVADMKIASLEDKSDKLRFQLKRANEIIARLTSTITDAEKMIDILKTVYEDNVDGKVQDFYNPKIKNKIRSKSKQKIDVKTVSTDDKNIPKTENLKETFSEKVVRLYNEGWSVDDIARMLDRGKGEVALILNFNNLKKGGINAD